MTAAAQSDPTRPKVILANINPGTLFLGFVQSLVAAQSRAHELGHDIGLLMKPSGPYLDAERNLVVEQFLTETNGDILLFIDSDVTFTYDDVLAITDKCAPHSPVISGIYVTPFRHKGIRPVIFDYNEENGHFSPMTLNEITARPRTGSHLYSVDGVGMGFCAIHRSLIESMLAEWGDAMPWFAENIVGGVHLGEDLTFCLRVKNMGYEIYCDPAVTVTHTKLHNFTIDHHITQETHKEKETV